MYNINDDTTEKLSIEIIKRLRNIQKPTKNDLEKIKQQLSSDFHIQIPKNTLIFKKLIPEEKKRLRTILKIKPVRTISGVNVVAVMTKPFSCPHGKCIYCPGDPNYQIPSAYTGYEPATMRGIQNLFNPYLQVKNRIDQLKIIGHDVDKIELIIMGGTFTSLPQDYQEKFIQKCLDAITGISSKDLEEAKKNAEISKIHNVGITLETRPDWAMENQTDNMLFLGTTHVELGVQTVYDEIYELINRGHNVKHVINATRIMKDSGLKIVYHMMPNLPGSNYDKDLKAFKSIFEDDYFKPDALKIYPTLVVQDTKLYQLWKNGEYKPYSTENVIKLIAEVKKVIPRWVRIQRIQRDIPSNFIIEGVKNSNLRQIVQKKLEKSGFECKCIRCREVGHKKIQYGIEPQKEEVKLKIERYSASEGEEIFLSYEDVKRDILIGFLRLRKPSKKAHRPEIKNENTMLIRELHVYGPMLLLGKRSNESWQHRGYGEGLLKKAEEISIEDYDAKKIVITSGLGVKEYYFRHGYSSDGPYVSKEIR